MKKNRVKPGYVGVLNAETNRPLYERGISALSKIGVISDPSQSDIEKGRAYLEKLADYITEDIKKYLQNKI